MFKVCRGQFEFNHSAFVQVNLNLAIVLLGFLFTDFVHYSNPFVKVMQNVIVMFFVPLYHRLLSTWDIYWAT